MENGLGEKLKKYRKRTFGDHGLRRVADILNLNYSYLYRVEVGDHIPSDETLAKMAKAYGLSVKEQFDLFLLAHRSPQFDDILKKAEKAEVMRPVFYRRSKKSKRNER